MFAIVLTSLQFLKNILNNTATLSASQYFIMALYFASDMQSEYFSFC